MYVRIATTNKHLTRVTKSGLFARCSFVSGQYDENEKEYFIETGFIESNRITPEINYFIVNSFPT